MLRSIPVVALLGLVLAAPGSAQSTPDGAADRDSILATHAAALDALRREDAGAIAAFFTADALALPEGAPLGRGRDAVEQGYAGFFAAMKLDSLAVAPVAISIEGPLGVEVGTYFMTAHPRSGGPAVSEDGKYLTVWRRQPDGSWRIAAEMLNSSTPGSRR